MPGNGRARLGSGLSGDMGSATQSTAPLSSYDEPTDLIPLQLRRRREASLRLPPLDSGPRDPWAICPPSSREPRKIFWLELKARGLLTDAVTAELLHLANELRRAA